MITPEQVYTTFFAPHGEAGEKLLEKFRSTYRGEDKDTINILCGPGRSGKSVLLHHLRKACASDAADWIETNVQTKEQIELEHTFDLSNLDLLSDDIHEAFVMLLNM